MVFILIHIQIIDSESVLPCFIFLTIECKYVEKESVHNLCIDGTSYGGLIRLET